MEELLPDLKEYVDVEYLKSVINKEKKQKKLDDEFLI